MLNQERNQNPFHSLRNFLAHLDQRGELIRIRRQVSPRFELAKGGGGPTCLTLPLIREQGEVPLRRFCAK